MTDVFWSYPKDVPTATRLAKEAKDKLREICPFLLHTSLGMTRGGARGCDEEVNQKYPQPSWLFVCSGAILQQLHEGGPR